MNLKVANFNLIKLISKNIHTCEVKMMKKCVHMNDKRFVDAVYDKVRAGTYFGHSRVANLDECARNGRARRRNGPVGDRAQGTQGRENSNYCAALSARRILRRLARDLNQ